MVGFEESLGVMKEEPGMKQKQSQKLLLQNLAQNLGFTRTQSKKVHSCWISWCEVATGAAVELTRRGAGVVSDKIDDNVQEELPTILSCH